MQDPLTRRSTVGHLLAAAAFGGAAGTIAGGAAAPAAAEPTTSSGAVVLEGRGIDPTGQQDSRAAVQALIDAAPEGATIVNPSGAVLRLNGGISIRKPHTRLTGSGEWRFRAGGTYSVDPEQQNGFIDLRADHCWVDGIHATNPDEQLGRGVIFLADYGRATDNTLIGFGSGIHVSPAGEFHDFTISGNHVLDVFGTGGGPDDTTEVGEDYGDGIMCWGAGVTITGNVVTCRDGADARIGIHVEGLGDQARRQWVHGDAMATITGNVVHGRFRRGIVSEEVDHVAITGNVVADATWWCIALITADHCVVSGNVLLYSRTARDTQGSAWNPSRSAITLYRVFDQTIVDPVVVDNTIRVLEGATAEAGIRITGNDMGPTAIQGGRIAGNRVLGEGDLQYGLLVDRQTVDLEVQDNRFSGFSAAGIALTTHRGAALRGNRVVGPGRSTSAIGIRADGGTRLSCTGNTVSGAAVGIRAASQSVRTVVSGNALEALETGIDLRGTTGPAICSDNVFAAVTSARVGLPAGVIALGNSA